MKSFFFKRLKILYLNNIFENIIINKLIFNIKKILFFKIFVEISFKTIFKIFHYAIFLTICFLYNDKNGLHCGEKEIACAGVSFISHSSHDV